ncbi:MAG: UDP-N-acetylmuramoyl-L-alanyl-D-glutamate--2,6-diaminopimelate ligase [Anaerolineae bacterium]|nr:UDP-N-acetylmuramoyl-L-alanyl-D-glutamate--2,6-diaminopimelate ligase [Gemmatimonadaceae bacterium]
MTDIAVAPVVSALRAAGLVVEVTGGLPDFVSGITDDSRTVQAGALFVAVRGSERDGHEFLAQAVAQGAVAAIVETGGRSDLPEILVRDGRRAAAIAAAVGYSNPVKLLRLAGVTGTNGKTTTVGILRHLLDDPAGSRRSASMGTLGVLIGSEGKPIQGGSGLTTPGPIELQRVFRLLADAGVAKVAMEVSSHSLDQRRVEGVSFHAAVFTNLTRDHLDYHGTMDEYRAAKAKLLEHLAPNGVAVINRDDTAWETLSAPAGAVSFAVARPDADVHALDVRYGPRGSEWRLRMGTEARDVTLPLIGSFNVANALGAAAAAWVLDVPVSRIAALLETIPQIPGRLEMLSDSPTVLRDYAHTPDALERALDAVRPFTHRRLIAVFGCGGDRDRGKRPAMGRVAAERADVVIVTSDNPRTEDPERILDDIIGGMPRGTHERVADRREAIARALDIAGEGDLIVLAGKGHETYQIKGSTKYPFDEREIVRELLAERGAPPAKT